MSTVITSRHRLVAALFMVGLATAVLNAQIVGPSRLRLVEAIIEALTGDVETFTDTAGVDLRNHSGELGPWIYHPAAAGGTIVISNADRARFNTAGATVNAISAFVPATNEYDVQYTLLAQTLIPGHYQSLLARWDGSVNRGYFVMYDVSASLLKLLKSGGTGTALDVLLDQEPFTLPIGTAVEIRLAVRRDAQHVFVDDVLVLTATDVDTALAPKGYVGFGGFATAPAPTNVTGIQVDDFTVTDFVRQPTTYYLSNLLPVNSTNGWGPIEMDRSNGESAAGDGLPLSLNGVAYAKGIGAHAVSSITYTFTAADACTAFTAVVGVDDEISSTRGSLAFQVSVNGATQYSSPVMSGGSASNTVTVPLSGAVTLVLSMTDGGDGVAYDHGDWADAKVTCTGTPTGGGTVENPIGFTDSSVTSGLTRPTAMEFTPDGRLFVLEQNGVIRVISAAGALLPTPFMTMSGVDGTGERGLLGIAFDPGFASNSFLYVYYTTTSGGTHNRISRFTANGDVVNPGTELVLMDFPALGASTGHNGGALHFGPDGHLYAGVGENDLAANSQSLSTTLGKMIRITSVGAIPTDNPFYGSTTGNNRAIWALGLRNPFTFAFHPSSSLMFINDVGGNLWEEINVGTAGANYGWPDSEGATTTTGHTSPRYSYAVSRNPECAISGGAFYDTGPFPDDYDGDYFFADFCGGWIRRLDTFTNVVGTFATGLAGPVDLKVSSGGALYYLTRGTGGSTGAVGRWTYDVTAPPPPPPPPTGENWENVGPLSTQTKPAGSLDLNVGENWAQRSAAAPSNAVFWVRAGVHRHQTITGKVGQTWVGEPGAIMSGARVLSGASFYKANTWVYTGITDVTTGDTLYPCRGTARCAFPNDLFADDYPMQHTGIQIRDGSGTVIRVDATDSPGIGQYSIDYNADRMYVGMADNPNNHLMELSTTEYAMPFNAPGNGITIRNLTIEKYAVGSHGHCVNLIGNSRIEQSRVRHCHYGGISANSGTVVSNNLIEWNGGHGLGGGADGGVLIDHNEVRYNNYAKHDGYWGAGGSKWVFANGLTVRNNYSHHNGGPGFWTDISNQNVIYEGNRIERNERAGIFHEVSYNAIIRNNTVSYNGLPGDGTGGMLGATWGTNQFQGFPTDCGISVTNSPDVEVYGNTITENGCGMGGYEDCRVGTAWPQSGGRCFNDADYREVDGRSWVYWNVDWHDNIVRQTINYGRPPTATNWQCCYGAILEGGGATGGRIFNASINSWENNRYFLGNFWTYWFAWGGERSDAYWTGLGHDVAPPSPGGSIAH